MRSRLRSWLSRSALLLAAALLVPVALHATDVPQLARHITDQTGTLTAAQIDQLDAQLVNLQKTKGTQLVVLMVGTTQPQAIEEYSLAVAEANKIGRKGTDDGVLLLLAKDDRRARIEVGYGLEGAIPDAAAAQITREYLAPKLRTNDYYGGISDSVGALTQLINGESLPPPVEGPQHENAGSGLHGIFTIGLFIAIFLRGLLGRMTTWLRVLLGAVIVGGLLWLMISLSMGAIGAVFGGLLMLLPGGGGRSIGGGGWGGFGGLGGLGGFGGFGGGGGGGGGFSGGGGSFGGGGASGSW